MTAEVDDRAFRSGLKSLLHGLERDAAQVVRQVGEDVADDMRSRAPVASGRLRGSIKSEPGTDSHGPYAEVSVEPFYASFKEWGTSRAGAEPFFRPGLETVPAAVRRAKRLFRL